jgi:hypothetical protein
MLKWDIFKSRTKEENYPKSRVNRTPSHFSFDGILDNAHKMHWEHLTANMNTEINDTFWSVEWYTDFTVKNSQGSVITSYNCQAISFYFNKSNNNSLYLRYLPEYSFRNCRVYRLISVLCEQHRCAKIGTDLPAVDIQEIILSYSCLGPNFLNRFVSDQTKVSYRECFQRVGKLNFL